jgi:hypothetical protein
MPRLLCFAYAALAAVALGAIHVFPSLDGPEHVHTSRILGQMLFHSDRFYGSYFQLDLQPHPNWFCQAFLMLGLEVFDGRVAEKLLIFTYLLAMMLSWHHLVRSLEIRSLWASCLVLPFILNHYLFLGFYNFVWSLPFFLWSLGLFLQPQTQGVPPSKKQLLLFSLSFAATYFCHVISVAELGLGLLFMGSIFLARQPCGQRMPCLKTQLLPFVAASLPGLCLLLWFWATSPAQSLEWGEPASGLLNMLLLTFLAPFSNPLWIVGVFCIIGFTLLAVLVAYVRPKWNWLAKAWLALAVLQAGIAVFGPEAGAGGSLVQYRLTLYPWISLLAAWACCLDRMEPAFFSRLVQVWAAAALLQAGLAWQAVSASQPGLRACLSLLDQLPSGSLIASYELPAPALLWRHSLQTHLAARATDETKNVLLLNAYQRRAHGFPVRFRAPFDPTPDLVPINRQIEWLNLASYEARSGQAVQFAVCDVSDGNSLSAQLRENLKPYPVWKATPPSPVAALEIKSLSPAAPEP